MTADMSDPKNWGIGAILYIFFMVVLWKFQIGAETPELFKYRIIISILFLPICFGIIYAMGGD